MVLNFGDADITQKATGSTSAQIDFVCVICTSNSSTAAVASLSLSLSLSVSLFKGTSHNIAISLPALFSFFRSYNEVFVETTFIPYYLSTDIDFVCVLCTSSSTAAGASLSFPLNLSVFVQGYLTQQYRNFSTYPFIFSQLPPDGTIIDSRIIPVTLYYCGYVGV